jgi:hypothetical protein
MLSKGNYILIQKTARKFNVNLISHRKLFFGMNQIHRTEVIMVKRSSSKLITQDLCTYMWI